ncbi:MAG: 30S ribosomal protein S20 [FCB group bacterium]|jgi:small subunit ribosomal protein S20
MAHHKSALKRIRQAKKLRVYNRANKKSLKLAVKAVRSTQNHEEAQEKLKVAFKEFDKISSRKVIHKNNAANKKSALAKYVNELKVQKN